MGCKNVSEKKLFVFAFKGDKAQLSGKKCIGQNVGCVIKRNLLEVMFIEACMYSSSINIDDAWRVDHRC